MASCGLRLLYLESEPPQNIRTKILISLYKSDQKNLDIKLLSLYKSDQKNLDIKLLLEKQVSRWPLFVQRLGYCSCRQLEV